MNGALAIPSIWTTGSTAANKTGTWRAALAQHITAPAPCHQACPMNGDIAEWIGQARDRDFYRAWQTLTRHNPFPAVIGRICHHPCESACNRAGHDEPLSICRLERFIGDTALEKGWTYPAPQMQHAQRIAVVGGGPSGLSAAFQLRRMGYQVTIFESQPQLGGLMRHGIPAYRLSRAVLDGEIDRLVAMGIDVRCNAAIADTQAVTELRAGFDAVYMACGAARPKRLPQLDYSRSWVVDGAEYLARASIGQAPVLGRRLVVIGGGSAALDVARSARRTGHAVTILALESEVQMPAQREEVLEAREEGITILGAAVLNSVDELGSALRLQCVRVLFAAGTRPGEFSLSPVEGTEFNLDADAVVSSIGQDPDLQALAGVFASDGKLLGIDAEGATSVAGVWAGGDMASNARFVSEAIGMGQRAALAIDRHLLDRVGPPQPQPQQQRQPEQAAVGLSSINLFYHPAQARAAEQRLAPAQRLASSAEVQLGWEIEQALAESARCFSCGTCTHCDNCITYCPDMAVQRLGDGYTVLTDYCKGCGVCVEECPTGSMTMLEEMK